MFRAAVRRNALPMKRRSTGICLLVLALIFSAAIAAEAQVTVSADVWAGDSVASNGDFVLYGRGVARSDAGWVAVTATLKDPAGGALDVQADLGTGSARADVDAVLNIYSLPTGSYTNYSTLAEGEDEQHYMGCQTSQIGLRLATTYFTNPTPVTGGCYYANTACEPGTTPTCSGGWTLMFSFGCPTYAVADFLVVNYNGQPICTVGVSTGASGPGACS